MFVDLSSSSWIWLLVGLLSVALAAVVWAFRERRPELPPARGPLLLPPGPAAVAGEPPGEPPVVALERPGTTRYPIVLLHGYFGFDAIGVKNLRQEYFRGVRKRLEALGHAVHVVRVSPTGSIEVRAAQLAKQIERIDAPRVNIVAHSMGGLDARYAITRLGLGPKVASLTTVGTPHRGTPLADRAFLLGKWTTARRMLASIGANVDGLYDLTTARMEAFNREILDSSDVVYHSVVAAVNADTARLNTFLAPAHAYLFRSAGPNDGIVPVESQRWGDVLHEVEADHWAQVGWSSGFDAGAFYVSIAERLALRGL